MSAEEREVLATAWLTSARMEHASIAAFGQLGLHLAAFGAPSELVERTHRAALDELRHARRCYALASAFGGAPVSAGPIRELQAGAGGPVDLVRLAVGTLVDGCVAEGIAADIAARGARVGVALAACAPRPHAERPRRSWYAEGGQGRAAVVVRGARWWALVMGLARGPREGETPTDGKRARGERDGRSGVGWARYRLARGCGSMLEHSRRIAARPGTARAVGPRPPDRGLPRNGARCPWASHDPCFLPAVGITPSRGPRAAPMTSAHHGPAYPTTAARPRPPSAHHRRRRRPACGDARQAARATPTAGIAPAPSPLAPHRPARPSRHRPRSIASRWSARR